MQVLVLGGTGFLGRHLVTACLARGHRVTLFCRGLSNPRAFPELERISGDRTISVEGISGRSWDAVLDTSGFEPRVVRASARAVASGGAHYVFVSSISVYMESSSAPDEGGQVKMVADSDNVALAPATYGALKAACEHAAEAELPGRVLSARAGAILGPHDNDDRFPWLLRRVAQGGEILAAGDPAAPVQLLDARDFATWLVSCAERRIAGVFNVVGPAQALTMRGVLETVREVTDSDARFTWVPDEILIEHDVAPCAEAPFWLPAAYHGLMRISPARAVATGLSFRAVADTFRDEWAWVRACWEDEASVRAHARMRGKAGLSSEREAHIVAALRARGPFVTSRA